MRQSASGLLWDRPETLLERVIRQIERVVIGKRESIEHILVALLSGGHVLLEDVPGVGKTLIAKTTAHALGCSFQRIQCTPDVLPSDIVGVTLYRKATETFEFRPGPIMANVVLADELNRTSPKTQSALLEAMEEGQVTVDGQTLALPDPFIVIATQNPVDFEGVYPLPEAQLDRFLMKIKLGYPSADDEIEMLSRLDDAAREHHVGTFLHQDEIKELKQRGAQVHVDESVKRYIVSLIRETRRAPELALGASPRATVALLKASQALALLRGRVFVIPDDCRALAVSVLAHRLVLRPEAQFAGHTAEETVERIVSETPVPSASMGGAV